MPSIPTTTVPTWPAAAHRIADPLRVVAFALAVFGLEAMLAHGIVGPQISRFVFLFIGLFAVAFVFRFPLATALVFLGLSDFIFFPTFFAYQVGPLSVRPHELALAGLLTVALLRPARQSWGGFAGGALAVFLALVSISAAIAVGGGGATLSDAFNWARPLFLLTFFYVIVRLFPSVEQRKTILLGAAVVAALTGVVALMVSLGAGFGDALASGSDAVRAENGASSIERVRLPGLSAGYALFWYTVVQIAAKRGLPRLGWTFLLMGIALDIVVSFNRNMWLGLAIGLVLMAIVGGASVRTRITAATAAALAGAVLFVFFGTVTSNNQIVAPLVKRGETILNPTKTTQENSLQDRARETDKAWATAKDHLLLGVGTGASFGVVLQQPIQSGSLYLGFTLRPQLYLHNQYLYLVLIAGVPGLIAFLLFLGAPIVHALRRHPRDPAIAACGVGVALIMISATVAIYFTVEDMTAVLGLLTGILVADAEGPAAAGEDSGLLA